jgi:hypothetical protein
MNLSFQGLHSASLPVILECCTVADTLGQAHMSVRCNTAEDLILTALRRNRLGLAAVLNKKALSQTAQDARKSRAKASTSFTTILYTTSSEAL